MFKQFILIWLSCVLLFGSTKTISKKIYINEKILKARKNQHKYTNIKIKTLAKQIKKQENQYSKLDKKLLNLNNIIFLNKVKLDKVKTQIIQLERQANAIKKQSKQTQNSMIDEITNRYSASLGVSLAKKQTLKEILVYLIRCLMLPVFVQKIVLHILEKNWIS